MGAMLRTFQEITGERLIGRQPKAPKPLFLALAEAETPKQTRAYLAEQYPQIANRYLTQSTLGKDGQETTRLEMLLDNWFSYAVEHPETYTLSDIVELAEFCENGKRPRGRPRKKPSREEAGDELIALFAPRLED